MPKQKKTLPIPKKHEKGLKRGIEKKPNLNELYKASHQIRKQLDILNVKYQEVCMVIDKIEQQDHENKNCKKSKQ